MLRGWQPIKATVACLSPFAQGTCAIRNSAEPRRRAYCHACIV